MSETKEKPPLAGLVRAGDERDRHREQASPLRPEQPRHEDAVHEAQQHDGDLGEVGLANLPHEARREHAAQAGDPRVGERIHQ